MSRSDAALATSAETRLGAIGWTAEDPIVRLAIPTIMRGGNLVATLPPVPTYAAPILAALTERRAGEREGTTLVVAPQESLASWGPLIERLATGDGIRPLLSLGSGVATRRLHASVAPNFIVLGPATVLALRRRAMLAAEDISALLIAWPDAWGDDVSLTDLMAGAPSDMQRVILTSSPTETHALAERHAWRAMTVGITDPVVPAGPVNTVSAPWGRRVHLLRELVEALEPESLAVWTADTVYHAEITAATTALGIPVQVTLDRPGSAAAVVAFDPPTPERLRSMLEVGSVTLLVPPGTERYVQRIASPRRVVTLASALEPAVGQAARRRSQVEGILAGPAEALAPGLMALAPLFEMHDPAVVAAALYHLWVEGQTGSPVGSTEAGVERIWIGVGRKDDADARDIMGLLANELRVDASRIGKIEVRETFTLVELPAEDAERIAQAVTGRTLRKRRLVARLDRPRERGGRPRRAPRGPVPRP